MSYKNSVIPDLGLLLRVIGALESRDEWYQSSNLVPQYLLEILPLSWGFQKCIYMLTYERSCHESLTTQ